MYPTQTPGSGWKYDPNSQDDSQAKQTSGMSPIDAVSWTASEYVSHQKTGAWYVGMSFAAVVIAGAAYLLTRDLFSTSAIAVIIVILIIYSARKPRTLQYILDQDGIRVGNRLYAYDDFRSFSVVKEGMLNSIVLMPHKRFMPPLNVYFPPSENDKIFHVLGSFLPIEEPKNDIIDSFMKKIHF